MKCDKRKWATFQEWKKKHQNITFHVSSVTNYFIFENSLFLIKLPWWNWIPPLFSQVYDSSSFYIHPVPYDDLKHKRSHTAVIQCHSRYHLQEDLLFRICHLCTPVFIHDSFHDVRPFPPWREADLADATM